MMSDWHAYVQEDIGLVVINHPTGKPITVCFSDGCPESVTIKIEVLKEPARASCDVEGRAVLPTS